MLTDTTRNETVMLTPAATQAVKDLLEKRDLQDYALRVFISGGGCSGLQYGMALEGNIRPTDLTCEFDGINVVIDEVSIDYLRGATIDYINDIKGSGFKIDNPNAISSCGCGNSSRTTDSHQGGFSSGGCNGCQ